MQKPNNYDDTKIGGQYTPISVGGHHMIIKQVSETTSSSGKPQIVILMDTAKNDSQPGFFSNEFANDIRPEKKWPYAGTKWINTEDENGNCSRSFKSFITAYEKSNGCEAIWGDGFTKQFKNKKIGAIYGEKENEYNGKTSMRHEFRFFCEDGKVDDAKVPDPVYLDKSKTNVNPSDNSFLNVPDTDETDLPF